MTASDPTWDQTIAAIDEAARTVNAADSCAVELTPITRRVAVRWASGGEFKHGLLYGLKDHEWTYCNADHLPEPQVCYGLGNRPGHLMCRACFAAACEADDRDGPTTCDWCGGVGPPYPAMYPIGPAVVLFFFCEHHVAEPDYSVPWDEWMRRLEHTLRTQAVLPAHRNRSTE